MDAESIAKKVSTPPAPEYRRAPCQQCGCRTERQAATRCKQTQDMTGEWSCYASDARIDEQGFFLFQTTASIERHNAWFEATYAEEMARDV